MSGQAVLLRLQVSHLGIKSAQSFCCLLESKKKKVVSERVKKTNIFINIFHLVQMFEELYRDIFLNGIDQVIHV